MADSSAATDDVIPASPLAFCLSLTRAYSVLSRRLDASLSALHGLSFNDFTILYHLSLANGRRLRRIHLAEHLGLTPSGVTRTLLPLEKLGWVAREADLRDARVAHATLTDAGQRLLTHALVSAAQVCEDVASPLTNAQRDGVTAAFKKLMGSYQPRA